MIKHMFIALCALILLTSVSVAADKHHVISRSEKNNQTLNSTDPCNSPEDTGLLECAQNKVKVADKKLNSVYKKLLTKLTDAYGSELEETGRNTRKGLIYAQRSWLKFRDENCEFVGDMYDAAPIWRDVYVTFCHSEMTESRVKDLQEYLRILSE